MKSLFIGLLTLICFTTTPFAEDFSGATFSEFRPIDVEVDFDPSYFESQPWIKEFRYVVVVNKANSGSTAQKIKVFEHGALILEGKVSTGRDAFEAKGEHSAKNDSWTVTPTGYYTPTFLDKKHRSSAYGGPFSWLIGGVKMPYAIFFNGDIALHQAPRGTESALGKKASGGCIRLSEEVASDLFNRVLETQGARIPKFKVDGSIDLDSNGNYEYRKESGFSALIIVKNKIE